MVKWLEHMIFIWKAPGSDMSLEARYCEVFIISLETGYNYFLPHPL
jgi:hypothetical protein